MKRMDQTKIWVEIHHCPLIHYHPLFYPMARCMLETRYRHRRLRRRQTHNNSGGLRTCN